MRLLLLLLSAQVVLLALRSQPVDGHSHSRVVNLIKPKLSRRSMKSVSSIFPRPLSVGQIYSNALWDPTPTTTRLRQKQLAYALGYPREWWVERSVETMPDGKKVISDRIHAMGTGKNSKSEYIWFHHEAAHQAAIRFDEEGNIEGSHLLPPIPLYAKGDEIQVQYESKWFTGIITKRKKQADRFLYTVHYTEDETTQSEVAEEDIQPRDDPSVLAVELGFPDDWKATRKGARYILQAPTGEKFTTKKAAMKFLKASSTPEKDPKHQESEDAGDPPWRTEGHELLGRSILWTVTHKVSGTRRIKVEQIGAIEGFIASTDLDKEGNPGFVSDMTGKPADLFNVVFKDDPNHPYAHHLLASQDLEEHEVRDALIEEATPSKSSLKRKSLSEVPSPSSAKRRKKGRH
jgi:hypothetical protein